MRPALLTICTAALLLACGCSRPVTVTPPRAADRAGWDAAALAELRRLGRDGDWLVIRGYHPTDNLVSLVTNAPFSHAAVLDLSGGKVIEANGSGIHATPLPIFVAKAHRLLLVRPKWSREDRILPAVAQARSLVGKPYDYTGLVGLNHPERYYCSELAVAVYRAWVRKSDHVPPVIPPHELYYWGTVLYDTGSPE
jgi:hypothetical protein